MARAVREAVHAFGLVFLPGHAALDLRDAGDARAALRGGDANDGDVVVRVAYSGINFKELFVADGHHRIEGFAQLDVKKDTKFMAIVFPKSKCLNLAYDRSVKFPDEYNKDNFLNDLSKFFKKF